MRGVLIAIEGPDGAGRTTLARSLARWLEGRGRRVTLLRLKHSLLAREALQRLQRRMDVAERALFLLYASDLADLETAAEQALSQGDIVLFDRYTLTPRVRALVRGVDRRWTEDVLSFLPAPDLTLLLEAPATHRLRRLLARRRFLQPREAGGDAGPDLMSAALRHQRRLGRLYAQVGREAGAVVIDASRGTAVVEKEAREEVERHLRRRGRKWGDGR